MSITSEWLLKPESNRSELWPLRHVISDLPWTTPFPRFLVGCSTTFSTVSARRLRSTPGSSTSMKTRSSPTCYLIVAIKYLDHKTYQKRHLCIDHERHPSVVSLKSNPKITILLPALQQQKESDLPSKGAQFPKQMDVSVLWVDTVRHKNQWCPPRTLCGLQPGSEFWKLPRVWDVHCLNQLTTEIRNLPLLIVIAKAYHFVFLTTFYQIISQ